MARESTLDRLERGTDRERLNARRRERYAEQRSAQMQSSVVAMPAVVEPPQSPFPTMGKGPTSGGE